MKLRKRLLALACTAALAIQLVLPVGAVGTGDTAKNEYPDYYTDYMIEALEQGDTIEGDDYTHKDTLFTASMVHNNPGLEPYTSNYNNSQFLADRSIDEQVFFLYDCAQYGLLWDEYDQSQGITLTEEQWKADPDGTKAQNDRKVFPYGSEARAWVEAKRADLHKKYDAADAAGVDVYFMMDMIVMPAHLKAMRSDIMSGKIDITKPEVQEVMDFMFQEMFTEFPTIDGIYIRYGETYTGTKYGDAAPYHTGNNPILHGEQSHMTLINYMSAKLFGDKRVDEAYRDVIYRTWGFGGFQNNPSEYLRVSENVPTNEHLYFCIKHSTGDFHRDVAFNQTIGIGQHQQIVEVQCAREYEGKGAYPNFLIHGVINGMEEYEWLNPDDEYQCLRDVINSAEDPQVKGIWIWPRGGGWNGPYINGVNGIRNDNEYYGQGEPRLSNPEVVIEDGSEMWNDLNAYVVTQWAKDTSKTDKYYVKEYAKNYLGMDEEDAENFYKLCILSEHAVLLGRGTNDPSVQSKCNDTWWTRDQNIAPGKLQNNINKAVNNNLQGTVLREKAECVAMWKEMLEIAQGFKTDAKLIDSPTVGVKDYIITTCKYGYYFFDITQQMYIAGIEKAKGEKNGECDINAIHDAVSEYDRLWAEWEELYETAPGCPSLFAKEDQSQNLIGYSSNRGTDAFMKNYRESLSMSGGVLVEKGGTAELPIQYSYGANPEYFTFESSDNSIATVDKDGIVTGVAAGKCLVTVRTKTSLAASTLVIVSEEGTLETETLFNETFETEDSEDNTANWGGSNGTVTWADGTIQVSNGNNSNGRTLSLNGPHTGKLTVSWRMKVDNTSDRAYVRLKDSKGLNLTQVEFRANQSGVGQHKIIIDAGSPDNVVSLTTGDYAADTWYDVKVDIDTAAGTYTVTIGDDSKSFTHFKDSDLADVNLIEVVSRTSNVTISIDDIRVTATLEAKITAKDIADSIHSTQLRTDEAALVMPVMPSGYTVSVKSATPSNIVDQNGKVTLPDDATEVEVIFQVTNVDDPSDTADTAPIKVAIPAAVHVESVSLNETSAELKVGETAQLTATVNPANATNKNVTWSTSNASVATVANGLVTGVAAGTATITVTTLDGSKTAACEVTVKAVPDPIISQGKPVTFTSQQSGNWASNAVDGNTATLWAASNATYPQSITVDLEGIYNLSEIELYLPKFGQNDRAYQYEILVAGADQEFKQLVDQTGNSDKSGHHVFALSETGVRYVKVNIIGCDNNPQVKKNAGVNEIIIRGTQKGIEVIPVAGVSLNKTELALYEGSSEQLIAAITPDTATNQAVTWTSSAPDVASVDNTGKVTAKKSGTATITVTTVDGEKTDSCTVTVSEVIRVACVGDSITFGSQSVANTRNYPTALQEKLGAGYLVKNFGVSGATMRNTADKPYTKQPEYAASKAFLPDIVIIMLGTNDGKSHNWSIGGTEAAYTEDAVALIEAYRSLESKPEIYFMTSPTAHDRGTAQSRYKIIPSNVNEEIVPLQGLVAYEEKCHFIDMNLATKNAKDYFPDDIHANNDGYELIGETVYRALIGEKTYLNPYALTAVILEAERKNADLYTEQSYQAMQEVLAQAKETQANAAAQSEFDAAYEALKTALAALEEKPRDPVISQNKPVSASSQEAANPASKAVDGNINSLWAAQGDSYPQSITVDFEGLYDLSELELYMPKHGANDRAYQFKVLVAGEDQQFKQVVDQTQNTDKSGHHIFALDESQVRYIKIQVVSCNNATNSGKNAGVNEIIVRGIPSVSVIPVTSVELDKTELTLTEGENAALRATVNPDNATNKNVTWTSSNEAVATVENGKVTAVAEGTVTITVTTVDGNKTATCTVTVKKAVEDESLLFEDDFSQDTSAGWTGNGQARVEDGALVVSGGTSGEMVFHLPKQYQGDLTVTFKMKVNNATDRAFFRLANSSGSHIDQVEFRGSYAPGCVVVDTGKVGQNPDQVGQYTPNQYVNVKIELNTYNKTQTITVNGGTPYVMDYYKQDPGSNTALGQLHIGTRRNAVFTIDDVRIFANEEIPVTGVTLNSEDFSLYEGQTKTVAATVEPFNATQKGVSWSTSNDDVVTVVDGKVTAVGAGEADITVITLEGNKSDSVHVKVLPSLPVQTIPYTDKNIRYVGRWLEEDGTMAGYWCGASFEICFKGYSCKVDMSADSGVIATVDGIATNIGSPKGQVDLSDYLDSDVEEHVVRITAKDYSNAKIVLRSIQICSEKGLEAPDDRLLIEVIGDSITAGATMGNRCVDAYGNVCARLLDADCAFVAHDSISLLDKHSGGRYANVDGMNKQYFKTKPWYYDSTNSDWDFSAYTPDVVIINLGTNDHGNSNPVDTPEEVQEFIQVYCDFVDKIHEQYGKDTPVLMMIPFQHLMEEYMREIYSELSEKGSCVYLVESADWVTKAAGDFADNYHPNAGGHQKIGKKLAEYIEGILAAPEANPVTVKTEGEGTANANVTEAKEGDTVTLTATPAKGWHFVEWKSEDIVVDENNTFTMPAKDVTVTAVFEQDEAQTVPVESVILDKASVELEVGKTVQLAATVLPENATNKAVIWSTSDASVATVENGLVTAVAKGTATITVTTEDGDKTATCAVTVKSASGNGGSASQYTITVQQADGGMITPSTTTVKKNDSKTFTIQANEGYVISDVLVDGSSVGAVSSYTFKKVISKHTITAVFEKVDVEESGLPFTDVKSGDWYHDAVEYVYGEGLMAGTSGKLFTPNGTLSRGMIVQILYSLEGKPETDADSVFDDVKAGAWYADAVNWAASVGVVSGYGNGRFGPDDSITREQLAAILQQYAALQGYKTEASGELDGFADADQVSGWATEAMQWAVSNGLMSGKNGGMLDPKGTATRAETAVILMQFCEKIAE